MVTLAIVTGIIWLIDSLFWAGQRVKEQKEPLVVEYARSFFPIIFVVLIIRSFMIEPFRIPSASMLPTLHIGDFILVNKFAYGVRLPVINTKIFEVGKPQRGDVFVFRYPQNPNIDYIKRVVGLPGDKVGYFNKTIYINGKEIVRNIKPKDISLLGIVPTRTVLMIENLGDHEHELLIDPERPSKEGEVIIPEGHYFAMGDNRDNSNDSRYWGTVPEENLVGKAFFVWMSWSWDEGGIVWQRLGNSIN
ncbi:MAG: signal peptidase I [Methylophaga sp.]|nr:MAG: signal peptidase I [Methylophaga sp.]